MRYSSSLSRQAALIVVGAISLFAPVIAMAGSTPSTPSSFWVNIDDSSETMAASVNEGSYLTPSPACSRGGLFGSFSFAPAPFLTCVVTQETTSGLGGVDISAQYNDPTPLSLGQQLTFNFNIFEPGNPQLISDTLSMTFTGLQPIGTSIAVTAQGNTSVDLHFLSGSLNELVNPAPLPGGISVGENADVTAFITTLSGAHVKFASDVEAIPEPATLALLGLGLAGIAAARRRKLH